MEASLSGRRKTNEARASAVPTIISLAITVFVLPLVLLALYLSLSSMFNTTHLRAFQFALYILLAFFCADHRNRRPIFPRRLPASDHNPARYR